MVACGDVGKPIYLHSQGQIGELLHTFPDSRFALLLRATSLWNFGAFYVPLSKLFRGNWRGRTAGSTLDQFRWYRFNNTFEPRSTRVKVLMDEEELFEMFCRLSGRSRSDLFNINYYYFALFRDFVQNWYYIFMVF